MIPPREHPTLQTLRLTLRRFELSDAARVRLLAGDRDIASTTGSIPHPYPPGAAETWIGSYSQRYAESKNIDFAIILRETTELVGCAGLVLNPEDRCAEMGYWIGKPYWGQKLATEAAKEIVRFSFQTLRLNRIYAMCLRRNPASRRVLEKTGLTYEGCLRQHVQKWGFFDDLDYLGMLRSESPYA